MKLKNKSCPGRKGRRQLSYLAVLLTTLLLQPVTASAQTSLADCTEIEDSEARLACYDEVTKKSRVPDLPVVRLPHSNREDNNSAEPPANPEPARVSTDDFGLEHKHRPDDADKTRTLRVASATHNKFSGWTIEFDDGQVWRQIGTDDYDIEVGERYTIRRAMLNSFLLSSGKDNRKIRVTRIK